MRSRFPEGACRNECERRPGEHNADRSRPARSCHQVSDCIGMRPQARMMVRNKRVASNRSYVYKLERSGMLATDSEIRDNR